MRRYSTVLLVPVDIYGADEELAHQWLVEFGEALVMHGVINIKEPFRGSRPEGIVPSSYSYTSLTEWEYDR